MQRRQLGTTTVAAIGLGCMGMSEFYGPTDEAQSLATLATALDAGVDFFDTADIYGRGRNEELLGRFLRGPGVRERVVLATKFGIVRTPDGARGGIDNSPAYLRACCEASLKRLGIETIDLYYCHRRSTEVSVEEMVGAMAELVRAGKVRQLGLSEVSAATLRRAHAVHPIAAVQSEYSLWSREPEQGMLAACAELKVAFVPYSPLGRAFLTGAIDPAQLAPDDWRQQAPRFEPENARRNRHLVERLAAFAAQRGITAAQVALAWVLCKHPHTLPIPGTRRVTYLRQNVAAAEHALSVAEISELDALFAPGAIAGGRYAAASMAGIEA